jgi:hypothetical protein
MQIVVALLTIWCWQSGEDLSSREILRISMRPYCFTESVRVVTHSYEEYLLILAFSSAEVFKYHYLPQFTYFYSYYCTALKTSTILLFVRHLSWSHKSTSPYREALALCLPPHPNRSSSLNSLAVAVSEKSNLSDQVLTAPEGLIRTCKGWSGWAGRHIRLHQVLVRFCQVPHHRGWKNSCKG